MPEGSVGGYGEVLGAALAGWWPLKCVLYPRESLALIPGTQIEPSRAPLGAKNYGIGLKNNKKKMFLCFCVFMFICLFSV